jgi:hypothetical protein
MLMEVSLGEEFEAARSEELIISQPSGKCDRML